MKQHDPIFFTPPSGRARNRTLYKGGGGDSAYYKEANRLYGVQADTAEFMLGIGQENLPGAVDRYREASLRYDDPEYADRMAGQAATTAQQAIDQTTATMGRNMARYGFNPGSGKWGSMSNQNAIQGAAIKAGSVNQALSNVEDKRFGAAKDFYSSMVGMPSDAAAQAGNAASGMASIGNAKQQGAANEAQGLSNIASLGYAALTMRDGGEVKAPRMAMGGLFAAGTRPQPMPPAAPVQQQRPVSMNGIKTASQLIREGPGGFANAMQAKGGKIMENVGNLSGNAGLSAEGLGAQASAAGQDLTGAIQSYKGAGMNDVAAGLAKGAGDAGTIAMGSSAEQGAMLAAQNAGMAGAEAATASALGGTAAAEGAGAMTGALAGASAAMPWLAAGVALGSVLGLFADGGEVTDLSPGGDVSGPGGPTDDQVPAMLSNKEFVNNAESAQMPRKAVMPVVRAWIRNGGGARDLLNDINDAGLAKREGYADGGFVSRLRAAFSSNDDETKKEEARKTMRQAMGNGMAGQAADAMRNRNARIEAEMRRQMGE